MNKSFVRVFIIQFKFEKIYAFPGVQSGFFFLFHFKIYLWVKSILWITCNTITCFVTTSIAIAANCILGLYPLNN